MNFVQSIKTCFRKYANFKGRAMRSEFWWFQLFMIVATYSAMALDHLLLGYSFEDTATPLALIVIVVTGVPNFAVTARRLHDIGWSGWIQIPAYMSYAVYLDVWMPGFSVSALGGSLVIGGVIYWVVMALFLIKDSQPKTNKYGPNPKNPDMGEIFT